MTTALILGRFQPLHNGHLKLIKSAAIENDNIVIAVGSAQYANLRDNPFSFAERKEMIKKVLIIECITNYRIVAVDDIYCEGQYVEHLEKQTGKFDVIYTGENVNTKKLFQEKDYTALSTERFFGVSATEVRNMMINGQDWEELVPENVAEYIKSINGIKRIKKLT